MQARLYHHPCSKEQKSKYYRNDRLVSFESLQGNDVIAAEISDHHPVIHDGVLFWNVMMQGKARVGRDKVVSYNNAFGIIESDKEYMNRLVKVGNVISEIVYHHPDIKIIGLCEGPIQHAHINVLIQLLAKFEWMERFLTKSSFHTPSLDQYQNWGLLMLADKKYKVSKLNHEPFTCPSTFEKLANRLQMWKLTNNGKKKYFVLAHFPFGGDACVTEKSRLSTSGNEYCELVNNILSRYANKNLIFCADFNFNPYLLNQWHDRECDQIINNNSVLSAVNKKDIKQLKSVTVDGILLSAREKQKHLTMRASLNCSKFLIKEYGLFKSFFYKYIKENWDVKSRLQNEYKVCLS